jgi:hypothetical protein
MDGIDDTGQGGLKEFHGVFMGALARCARDQGPFATARLRSSRTTRAR